MKLSFSLKQGRVTVSVFVLPRVAQDGGVVQRSPAIAVRLVNVGAVLQQELAGCQGVLTKTGECVSSNTL